jgi:hypothetical protein
LAQINPRVYNDKNTLDFRGDMSQMTLGNVLPLLARHINTTFALQITDPQHPVYGGIVNPDWGLAAPGHATSFIAGCGFLYLAHMGHQRHALDLDPAELLAKGGWRQNTSGASSVQAA